MIYIVILVLLVGASIACGYGLAARGGGERQTSAMAIVPVLTMAAWFGVSWLARRYADTDHPGWQAAEWWAHSGKWFIFAGVMLFFLGFAFGFEDPHARWPRVLLGSCAVLLVVWTTVWRTIPVYAFLPRTVTRGTDGNIRQTVEYTCGPVSLANLMERHFGMTDVTEREMARLSGCTYEGTTLGGLMRAARKSGLRVAACRTMSMPELEALKTPAIISISTIPAVRHATLFWESGGDEVYLVDPGSAGRFAVTRERFLRIRYGKTLVLVRGDGG